MQIKKTDHSTLKPGDNGDEVLSNHSSNRHFAEVLETRLHRRAVLQGSLGLAVTGLFGMFLPGCGGSEQAMSSGGELAMADLGSKALDKEMAPKLLGFQAIPVSDKDTVVVPVGYRTQVLMPWGEPITGSYPAYCVKNTGAQQAEQVGSHHDGMHFFPIEGKDPYQGSSEDGLLVMNHEYVEPRFMHTSAAGQMLSADNVPVKSNGLRHADEVLKEINAHGVSIARIAKGSDGRWTLRADTRNRRITGSTPMEISGPLRGSDFVKTLYSPRGTKTRGTLNNCSHGVTPWNTYLTAEENWAGYFINRDQDADQNPQLPREHSRYGVRNKNQTSRYLWDQADSRADEFIRFDASTTGKDATEDYRNEPNCFGWIVEIDPFHPQSTPIKRTALGRFAHEGVVFHTPQEGQPIVCYSGDDANNEYIYKFVSAQPYHKASAGGHLLDTGTLFVAKFNDDGSGEWLPLVYGHGPLVPSKEINRGFSSQADVLVNTRLAADALGATPMDRPEWGAVDPANGDVYFTLTNNTSRTPDQINAANPRANNRWGQIIRWKEAGNQASAIRFEWDLFLLAGPKDDSEFVGQALTEEQIFNSPDGLWIDADSRLWIQTDTSESVVNQGDFAQFGNNQMLVADPRNKELRRFLTGPIGQEITGVITTPDQKTMFINVQHPGATTSAADFAADHLLSQWPDYSQGVYPRSATVVITKEDGGVIGQ